MDNTIIVIFGASGDLTCRKLIPALHHLFVNKLLPENFAILGASRSNYTDESFREHLCLKKDAAQVKEHCKKTERTFYSHIYYQQADSANDEEFAALAKRIKELAEKHNTGHNVLYYYATPPSLYSQISKQLVTNNLHSEEKGWKRLIIEKPFGYDLHSAQTLDAQLHRCFNERQIYRIDHYLGKETVQNLLVFRFSNSIFEPLWSRNFIDHIEVTAAEFIGVEKRGGYYDKAGAVRDMLQNHLLQVLAMITMEPPAKINAQFIRDEAVKVMQCFRPLTDNDLEHNLILGQYTESTIQGKYFPAYRNEPGVAADSRTETYVALKMFIDNWRWQGVPFYLRIGKRLPTRATEIILYLKETPHPFFAEFSSENKIIIRIQPDEGIMVNFALKKPGIGFRSEEVSMNFHYNDLDNESDVFDAYERLLLDAINGDATLFARTDAVEACWEFVQPILDFKEKGGHLYGYAAGTWGPQEAEDLLANDKRMWRFPCKNLTNTDYCEL